MHRSTGVYTYRVSVDIDLHRVDLSKGRGDGRSGRTGGYEGRVPPGRGTKTGWSVSKSPVGPGATMSVSPSRRYVGVAVERTSTGTGVKSWGSREETKWTGGGLLRGA